MKMTVNELINRMALEPLNVPDGEREVSGGYCGDLLSWVMGRAQADDAWITVMGNVNAVAVSVLADVSCIILADSSALDNEALERAKQQDVNILRSEKNQYELCCELEKCIK